MSSGQATPRASLWREFPPKTLSLQLLSNASTSSLGNFAHI